MEGLHDVAHYIGANILLPFVEFSPYLSGLTFSLLIIVLSLCCIGTLATKTPHDLEHQSVAIDNKKGGESSIYRNSKAPRSLVRSFPDHQDIHTLSDLLHHAVDQFQNQKCIGSRVVNPDSSRGEFKFKTYAEYYELVKQLSAGLINLGSKPGDKIGLFAINSESWKVSEYACYENSLVIVSLYATLGPDAVQHIIQHADISVVMCAPENYKALLAVLRLKGHQVKRVIVYSSTLPEGDTSGLGIAVYTYDEVLREGKDHPQTKPRRPSPEDLCTIMYTSGTTGKPKGVMITHGNIVAALGGFEVANPSVLTLELVYLSYLPLAHIMERVTQATLFYHGATIGFYSGDIRKLMEDFVVLKPTYVVGAPRIYQRIYDRVMNSVESSSYVKRKLFKRAYNAKKLALERGSDTPVWNKLVFNKINKQVFGGRVQLLVSGSAPLSSKVHEFLRICFTPIVAEGYGLTESTAATCIQLAEDIRPGTVGPPVPSVELKLVDVPEMKYFSTDNPPRGEICIRGPSVTSGYFKDEQSTKEAFIDGWFRTGDIGKMNPHGGISVIDRRKNIFKLSLGEYVAPENLENVYCRCPLVAQCFVYGDSFQSQLVGVIVPDEEQVMKWAAQNGKKGDLQAICALPEFKASLLTQLTQVAKEAKVNSYELLKDVIIEPVPWTPENMLTPTMKLKRADCKLQYASQIKDLYNKLNPDL
eukprot:TRINITY_DN4886_c0_g1_i1.p1 TRINITY_DN4886_c0_g1~~TRINITY_DN4886_c0_g1_i1.p1  ORF type:complete len:702 (+),score=136.40 TRINITY_DN4886_c0_g1_i1:50-2155(+)